ncbi:MAG: primosomal protein N' [Clostridia bacterium]|nr:primosomal protein N' [Clostridia bacterium]
MIAEIIVDVLNSNIDKIYDYKIPDKISLKKGIRVIVPFGKRILEGFVIDIKETSHLSDDKLKSVIGQIDDSPLILPEMLSLMHFMVKRYNIKYVDALRLFIPSELRTDKIKPLKKTLCTLNEKIDLLQYELTLRKNSFRQHQLLAYLKENKCENQTMLNQNFTTGAVNKFKKDKVILIQEIEIQRTPLEMTRLELEIEHTPEQRRAIETIEKYINKNSESKNLHNSEIKGFEKDCENITNNFDKTENKTFLLHGVTGSGKTEVYLSLIEKVLKLGKTAIMLVPEISLTPQMLGTFKSRLGANVAVLHSGLSSGERFDEWRRILFGEASVVIGARSAIFAPLKNIGIIVIDEEHETSYNSESNPRYKTHEIACFRMRFNNCPLVLGSATPSLKSYYSATQGKITLLEMPVRTNKKEMPEIQIVDMMSELRAGNGSFFSVQLVNDLNECIKKKQQALLFLNRRGFTSFMRCRGCGYVAKCTDCDISLVYHKAEDKLKCHYCGKRYKALTVCPECKSGHIRQGAVGTQKIVDEFKRLFPDVKVFRMDNDTTRNKNAHQKILTDFSKHRPAVLVGTQMIAKGHDFDAVSLVGIIDADIGLYQTDYQGTEKTFQLITQVSGRAGRRDGGGEIVLQTFSPAHYVYKFAANYNYKGFYDKEINIRQVSNFPPFSTIVRILITHEKEELVRQVTQDLFKKIKPITEKFFGDFYYCEPMKSPHMRIKNKYRYQILMRLTKIREHDIIKDIYEAVNLFKNSKASVFVEIDPSNLS